MKKRRVAMTVSLPSDIASDYEKMAKKEAKNKSELFREIFKFYKKENLKEEFLNLQEYGSKLAKERKIFTEEDVEKIVFERRRKH